MWRAEGQACADPGARTPIGASRNFIFLYPYLYSFIPSGRKVTGSEERKNAINRGHYLLPATPKGSARTLFGPIRNRKIKNIGATFYIEGNEYLQCNSCTFLCNITLLSGKPADVSESIKKKAMPLK